MRSVIALLTVVLLSPATTLAAAMCCTGDDCCVTQTCCKHEVPAVVALDPIDPLDLAVPEPSPTREYARVFFHNPVKVGDRVLMGAYVIEHDTERMAKGGPCTYIYAEKDRQLPVVAFHCRHLTRKTSDQATVTLRHLPDMAGRIFELVEFQFAGTADAHGVPLSR